MVHYLFHLMPVSLFYGWNPMIWMHEAPDVLIFFSFFVSCCCYDEVKYQMFYAGDVSLPLGGTSHYEGRGKEEVFLGHFDLTDGHAEEKKENETLEERRERKEKDREERKINKQTVPQQGPWQWVHRLIYRHHSTNTLHIIRLNILLRADLMICKCCFRT